jgi:hypothetical protein
MSRMKLRKYQEKLNEINCIRRLRKIYSYWFDKKLFHLEN